MHVVCIAASHLGMLWYIVVPMVPEPAFEFQKYVAIATQHYVHVHTPNLCITSSITFGNALVHTDSGIPV